MSASNRFLRSGLKQEAVKLAFLIGFPVAITIVLTNPNIIPKLVNYYNYVQYPQQVDITKDQIERNIEFHEVFQRKFDEEVQKMKAQQQLEINNSNSSNSNKGQSS